MVSTWKKNNRKTSKFVDARRNNWSEREEHGMDQEGIMEKINKALGTERCECIDTLYINNNNNNYYYYYYYYYYYCYCYTTIIPAVHGAIAAAKNTLS